MNKSNLRYPTKETYEAIEYAYDYYNREIFDGALGACLITLNRKKNVYGYFSSEKFQDRNNNDEKTDEIALNPMYFDRSVAEILSVLVHEMVHLWQQHYGKAGRGRYHNKEWGDRMEIIGLMPSSTGQVGGKRTGDRLSHYIINDGLFETLTNELFKNNFKLSWQEVPEEEKQKKPRNKTNRYKFVCSNCHAQAWGKETLKIACADCNLLMEKEEKEE